MLGVAGPRSRLWPGSDRDERRKEAILNNEELAAAEGTPLAADSSVWRHPVEYGPCQALADAAREAGAEALRYESVRDPKAGAAVAILTLTCAAFAKPEPLERQTWKIGLDATGAHAICQIPPARLEFNREAFAADPRLGGKPPYSSSSRPHRRRP